MQAKAINSSATLNREVQCLPLETAYDIERIRMRQIAKRLRVTPTLGRIIAEHAFSTMEAAAR